MKPQSDSELLVEWFAGDGGEEFRDKIFRRTLRAARQRRRSRLMLRTAAVLASLGVMALVFKRASDPASSALVSVPPQSAPAFSAVSSVALSDRAIVRSRSDGLVTVRTDPGAHLIRTSDDDLLTSLGNRPAALVRPPGQPARLVLAQVNRAPSRP